MNAPTLKVDFELSWHEAAVELYWQEQREHDEAADADPVDPQDDFNYVGSRHHY